MNATAHQVADRSMDQAVTLDGILPGEGGSDYGDFVMAALLGAGMTGVQVRFVLDGERLRVQYGQTLAQQGGGFGAHAGSAFLNGLMVTFSYTPAAT